MDMQVDVAPSATPAETRPATDDELTELALKLHAWRSGLDNKALEYLWRRFGVTTETAERLGLGKDGRRLVIPFRDRTGLPRGYQSRALEKGSRWMGPSGAHWTKLAWFDGQSDWDEVIVTEGPSDGLTAVALGYDTIAIRGAPHASNPDVVAVVVDWTKGRTVILAGDADNSGQRFNEQLAAGIIAAGGRVKFLPIPEGMDLTAWREENPSTFSQEVTAAIQAETTHTDLEVIEDDPHKQLEALYGQRDIGRYPLSDLGNARFVRDMVRNTGGGIKFSPEAGFYLLNRGIWRPDRLDRIRSYVQAAADRVLEISNQLRDISTDKGEIRSWLSWAKYSQSSQGISAALRELQALPDVAVDIEKFDRHHDVLATRNGVINLRTGMLQPHDPSLLLTKRIDLDYDPDTQAPRWEQFLGEVFPDNPEMPAYLQRLIGYGITGETGEQTFAVLWGRGSNGKSTFTDTLTTVFRDVTTTTPFSTFEDRGSGGIPNDIAALKGARLVMASEGEQGKPMAEAVLKRVTGADMISARFMRREWFEFRPTFLLMLATNNKPSFKGQDEGLWRRVKLIPWQRFFQPEERDHTLQQALEAEAAGILAWAVRGSVEWYQKGLQDPASIRAATKEYRQTSDALDGFLPGVWDIDKGSTKKISGKLIYDSYSHWCDAEGLMGKERWTRRALFNALEERGAVKKHTNSGSAFEGMVKR